MECLGCGMNHSWESDQTDVCQYHLSEYESKIQGKLSKPVIHFLTKNTKLIPQRMAGICELATFMEMMVTPHPEPEEPIESGKDESDSFARKIYAIGLRDEGKSLERPVLHRPSFTPDNEVFPNVVNLTLEISVDAGTEIKRRLFDFFESYTEQPNSNELFRLKPEFMDTCRFDFKKRFPNLKMMTVFENSDDPLLPLFLLPPTIRVFRANQNVLCELYKMPLAGGVSGAGVLSQVPHLRDLLVDFELKVASTEEPQLALKLDSDEFPRLIRPNDIDLTSVPYIQRLRLSNAQIVKNDHIADRHSFHKPVDPTYPLCEFLGDIRDLPRRLQSFELPYTATGFVENFHPLSSPSHPRNDRLFANLRCEFPPNIKHIDISFPSWHRTPTYQVIWQQYYFIYLLVKAYEICYFEDVFSTKARIETEKIWDAEKKIKSRADRVAMGRRLKQNLRMFLGGRQFGLPTTFADSVISQIDKRFSVFESKFGLAREMMSKMGAMANVEKSDADSFSLQSMVGRRMEHGSIEKPTSFYKTELHITYGSDPTKCRCDTCTVLKVAKLPALLNRLPKIKFSISDETDLAYDVEEEVMHSSRSPRHTRSPSRSRSHASAGEGAAGSAGSSDDTDKSPKKYNVGGKRKHTVKKTTTRRNKPQYNKRSRSSRK